MKYLIVVAHPDDEVLGAGGAIYQWTKAGHNVDLVIMSAQAKARTLRPSDVDLGRDMHSALKYLGIKRVYEGTFPNIEMNTIAHLELVKYIEHAIIESEPDIVITHHPADVNNDHVQTSLAAQAAIRIFQRRDSIKRINEFWYMEVPSCSEWAIDTSMGDFRPNCFVKIGEEGLNAKLKALSMYRDVMRSYPHPRSEEYIRSLAIIRGAQWGCSLSEGFEVVLRCE